MNHLSTRRTIVQLEDVGTYPALELLIDGRPLIDMVREFERPHATREGHPDLAGSYAWLYLGPNTIKSLSCDAGDHDSKAALLGCSCGVTECWPLLARISIGPRTISWSDFEQPHRSEHSAGGHWNYTGFGPFVFARHVYEDALKMLF